MKRILTIFILVILYHPLHAQEEIGRYYKSEEIGQFGKLVRFFIEYNYVTGSDLYLKKDSSFTYRTCSRIMEGEWNVKNDVLLLFVETNRWRNDSLNEYRFNNVPMVVKDSLMKFRINENGYIMRKFMTKINEREFVIRETLVKDTLPD